MENTLYYAFSTIAATFGSAFGLIVAAAIFRIQRIDQIASPLSEKLSQAPSVAENRLELERITTVYNWKKYVKRWKEIDGQLKEGDPRYEATLWWLLKEIAHRLDFIRMILLVSLVLTILVIGACFWLIAFSNALTSQSSMAWRYALWPVEALASICLICYLVLVILLAVNLKDYHG